MPVTIILRNEPEQYSKIGHHRASDFDFLQKACPNHSPPATAGINALEGTWKDRSKEEDIIMASSDSFVRDALEAYTRNLQLVTRPDEVWFTILTQLSFYMTANIETGKDPFVPYEAQKDLIVLESLEMRHLLGKFHDAIQDRFKMPWLGKWVMPDFSTTKPGDCITAGCLMMGTMEQKSFTNPISGTMGGIPSITLLGEVDDWQRLVHKLDRLELEYVGQEPAEYAASLRTVLNQFVYSFDDADRADINEFWNAIIRGYRSDARGGSAVVIDGWLLEFLRWDKSGNPIDFFDSQLGSMTDSDEYYSKMSPSFAMQSLPNAVGYVTTPFGCANGTRQDVHPYDDDIRGSSTLTHGSSTWKSTSVQGTDDSRSGSLRRLLDSFKRRQARINGRFELPPQPNRTRLVNAPEDKKVTVLREFKVEVETYENHPSLELRLPSAPLWEELVPFSEMDGDRSSYDTLPPKMNHRQKNTALTDAVGKEQGRRTTYWHSSEHPSRQEGNGNWKG